jgi:hypothetical protein
MRAFEMESRLDLHVLCHEHHQRLGLETLPVEDHGVTLVVYACPNRGCRVHYNSSQGYFILSGNGHGVATGPISNVRCKDDGTPMFLAEIRPEKGSVYLWRCPKCNVIAMLDP